VEAVFEFGGNLYEIVVIKLYFFLVLVLGADVDGPVCHAEVQNSPLVQVVPDAERLQNEGALETCTDVNNCVV
jgi:hypothetical protein